MISIYEEIEKVRNGKYDSDDNPIKKATANTTPIIVVNLLIIFAIFF